MAASARHSRAAVSITLCKTGCSSNFDRLMTRSTSEVAACRSRASFSSRVSRATSALRIGLDVETGFCASRRFGVTAFWRPLIDSPPAPERRLMASPGPATKILVIRLTHLERRGRVQPERLEKRRDTHRTNARSAITSTAKVGIESAEPLAGEPPCKVAIGALLDVAFGVKSRSRGRT
jgi:hypothetical protein